MTFVDTNYWLRYLIEPRSKQGRVATDLFTLAAAGKAQLASSGVVFFEIYFVLHSVYHLRTRKLQEALISIFLLDFVYWPDKQLLQEAVFLMDEFSHDLEDAYNFLWAKHAGCEEMATFDRKLSRKWLAA